VVFFVLFWQRGILCFSFYYLHLYLYAGTCKWLRRVWRYQRGNQNPFIEEEQTTQWSKPKENVQKDKQRSTKHTYKTKDRVTRTPLKPGGELMCSGRLISCYRNIQKWKKSVNV
jgi:hypothetical protein